jgi:arsenate reductase
MTTLYGIPNCDTVKKARRWLDAHGIAYTFHDFRRHGLSRGQLQDWEQRVGWEVLLNRRGTTWRRLPEPVRTAVNRTAALHIMLEQPAVIRRPVLEHAGRVQVGFRTDEYRELFA